MTFVLFGGLPGGPEMLIILLIVVLLFGANKLPELARSTGQAMGEFRRGRDEIEQELRQSPATSGPTSGVGDTEDDVDLDADTERDADSQSTS
ncbi:Sec-independent protein translocase subunit TatA/TatB [Haloprofundus halobius]|uniref:Sec-independent protein translocase subunit TatA/TatB n=1 Tax=Haloprofundus halobius TaxID=2876194 RepID=UPI001CCDD9B1|nr:twin-arginine translocase TatA/TatE family subunit [Haloprofundus halobius]